MPRDIRALRRDTLCHNYLSPNASEAGMPFTFVGNSGLSQNTRRLLFGVRPKTGAVADFSVGKNRWTKVSGSFRVKEREKGELAITIEVGERPLCTDEGEVLYLTQSLADTIQRSPSTARVSFVLCQGV